MNFTAIEICENLTHFIKQQSEEENYAKIHSVFDNAVNICIGDKILTLISETKFIQPYCVKVNCFNFNELNIKAGQTVILSNESIRVRQAKIYITLQTAKCMKLNIDQLVLPCSEGTKKKLTLIARAACEDLSGISPLIFGVAFIFSEKKSNYYTEFLEPKIKEFDFAFNEDDFEKAVHLSGKIAGCGPGLTPSSDDFLLGYILAHLSFSNIKNYSVNTKLLKSIAYAAAKKTNIISGNFLKQAGDGLCPLTLLKMLYAYHTNCADAQFKTLLQNIAKTGATSGKDILTGVFYALKYRRNEI